jgi:hypothetical protein
LVLFFIIFNTPRYYILSCIISIAVSSFSLHHLISMLLGYSAGAVQCSARLDRRRIEPTPFACWPAAYIYTHLIYTHRSLKVQGDMPSSVYM